MKIILKVSEKATLSRWSAEFLQAVIVFIHYNIYSLLFTWLLSSSLCINSLKNVFKDFKDVQTWTEDV